MIPRSERCPGEGVGYPLQYSWASLVAQTAMKPPAIRETWVRSLDWEGPLEEGMETHSSVLAWRTPMDTQLSDQAHTQYIRAMHMQSMGEQMHMQRETF